MTDEEKKGKRIEYLMDVIHTYLHTEPRLSMEEFTFAVCYHLGEEFEKFLKEYKKELKRP